MGIRGFKKIQAMTKVLQMPLRLGVLWVTRVILKKRLGGEMHS